MRDGEAVTIGSRVRLGEFEGTLEWGPVIPIFLNWHFEYRFQSFIIVADNGAKIMSGFAGERDFIERLEVVR